MSAIVLVQQDGGLAWIKTARGWTLRTSDMHVDAPVTERRAPCRLHGPFNKGKDENFGRNVRITGTKMQRKISTCVSDFIGNMCLEDAVFDLRRQHYLHDLLAKFFTDLLGQMSGTSHRQLFKILESVVNYCLDNEIQIPRTRALLQRAWESLPVNNEGRIGSKSVWKRHTQTIGNLMTKINNFVVTERQEDGLPGLLDLPKECIIEIMMKLSDHRDLIHLGMTCTDMYHISQSPHIWQNLNLHHFSLKQMSTFTLHEDFAEGLPWKDLFERCVKKFGLRQYYTDQLVLCSACKTLHWLMIGHACWSLEDETADVYLEPISPEEIVKIFP